jgi:uracil-DNA glycosylase
MKLELLPSLLQPGGSATKVSFSEDELWFGTSGPRTAKIVIVGEAWGYEEQLAKSPFVGASGQELTRILKDAGIDRADCLVTNVAAIKPTNNELYTHFTGTEALRGLYPDATILRELSRLYAQLAASPRTIIIATGNYALWALSNSTGTGPVAGKPGFKVPTGIMSWRGSMIHTEENCCGLVVPLLPIIHPAAILRQWDLRYITVHDLRARVPMALRGDWVDSQPPIYFAPPTFEQACSKLDHWLRLLDKGSLRLASDIETFRGFISCIGFADSPKFGMSIPFVRKVNDPDHFLESYWPPHQEAQLVLRIRKLFNHPNLDLEGQNFLYDVQYIHNEMGVLPYANFDSMYAWHVCFPGTPKALDYLSSLFCRYHRYWKEDHKEWDLTHGDVSTLLRYNAEDCVRTFEACTQIRALVEKFGLADQWEWMKRKRDLALRMMLRGVKIDKKRRDRVAYELMEVHGTLANDILSVLPQEWYGPPGKNAKTKEPVFWFASHKQLKWLFGEFLGIKIPFHRKTKAETLGKEALNELREKYPIWKPLFNLLADLRSVGVFITHFIRAPLDPDGRMRCSFNPAGTETFRWSSSKNAYRRGANLQNLPKGDED